MNGEMKDEELVALARNEDNRAMDELLLRYSDMVQRKSQRFFLMGGESEDLIQEGMIGLYNAIHAYKPDDNNLSFKNFAHLCVGRRLVDAVKTSARKKNLPLNEYVSLLEADELMALHGPDDALIKNEDEREFYKKISKELSNFEFKVIVMYIQGVSYSEICEITHSTEKRVDNAIQRSKKKLKKAFGSQDQPKNKK